MTDNLRDRIAAVQAAHCQMPWGCLCGWKYAPLLDDSHYDHVADAVIEALPELNPDHVRAKYLKDWEEGYDEGYSAGGGGC